MSLRQPFYHVRSDEQAGPVLCLDHQPLESEVAEQMNGKCVSAQSTIRRGWDLLRQ